MKKSSNSVTGRGLLGVIAIAMAPVPMPAVAQDDSIFEEIVVRAQRRDQNIMEVPVAVTAVSGAEIQESGIRDVFELQQNVPGLIVGQSQTTTTSNFSIRGIGSTSNNFGVESSVGLYVDEVYRPRQSSIVNELVDVEAVEVLRGPQGTLFGKNTAAGAIQIRTVAPSSDASDAFVELQAGDFGLIKLSGATNIPLTDALAFRGTAFMNKRDGYVDDDNFGADFHNDRDRLGFRAQLGYRPSDTFNMRIIADYSELEETCCVAVARVDGLYSRATVGTPTPQPGSDAALAQLGGRIFTDFGYPDALLAPFGPAVVTGVGFDEFRVAYNDRPLSTNEDSGLSLEINKTFDNGMTLTSITALRMFDTTDFIDGDFSSVDMFTRSNDASQESLSQEFRLSGDFGNGGNYVAGVYYFGQEIESLTNTNAGTAFNDYILLTQPDLAALVAGVEQVVSLLPPGSLPPVAQPYSPSSFATNDFTQDQDGWAAFGQVDFPLGDSFIATLGLRYTDETKEVVGRFTDSSVGPPPDLAAIQAALIAASQGQPFDPAVLLPVLQPNESWGNYLQSELSPRPDVVDELSDDQTTGTVKLTWFPTGETMLYASYSTGFKSGGTNTDRIPTVFSPIFGAETSKSAEIGFKGDIGPVRLSVAVYQTDFEDFQANSFTGTGFNLQNAGDVEIKGIEIEGLWRPTDTTEIQGFYARNEGDYKSFVGGTCWDTYPFHTGIPDPGGQGPTAEVCDKTGLQLPYNPEDRAFLAVTQNFPFGDNNFFVRAEGSYYSEQFTDGDLDPFTKQDAVTIVNLRAGFDFARWNSTLTFWGRNITDERFYTGSFDAPLSLGRMNSYPSEPLSWGVTLRTNFD
jgi:outer membrane receptor protein involved in Fe transport